MIYLTLKQFNITTTLNNDYYMLLHIIKQETNNSSKSFKWDIKKGNDYITIY